jgi:hypothetical protein
MQIRGNFNHETHETHERKTTALPAHPPPRRFALASSLVAVRLESQTFLRNEK